MFNVKKKRMVKVVGLMTAAALGLSILGACGQKEASDKNEQGKTVISVGNWPQKEGTAKTNMEKRKARFEEANSEFAIEPSNWEYDLKTFYAKAAGGQLPVLFSTAFTEASNIIPSGYAADLTDELKRQGLYDQMNKQILELLSKDGRVYAYPKEAYILGLICNIDDFEKAGLMNSDGTPYQPKTWEELAQVAAKLKAATGKPGFILPTSNRNGGWMFTEIVWSFGVDFMKKDENGKWKATFDTPEAAEALQYVKDLKWKYDVLPANNLIDGTEMHKIFGIGGGSMLIGAGAKQFSPYETDVNSIGMMATPAGPKKRVTLLGGTIYEVNGAATKKQIEGAIKWIRAESSPDLTDEYKKIAEDTIKRDVEDGSIVTVKSTSPWSIDSETVKYNDELIAKYANANPAHVKLYNDFIRDLGDCELRAEEPMCAQDLYGILDNCIQAVLSDKNADCAELMRKANSDFQQNYLDNVDY